MKRTLAIVLAALAVTATVGADLADARRLGGGRSLGAQRQSVAPPSSPSAAPSQAGPTGPAANPVMPAQPAAGAAAVRSGAPAAAAAPARTGMARWMGPLAGVAAGLGLAWLAHSLGLSEALLSALLIGLMVIAGIALIRMFMTRRTPPRQPIPYAGGSNSQRVGGYETQVPPAANPRTFEPAFNTGTAAEPLRSRFPAGFDPEPFLDQAESQFRRLQAAYDTGDREALADVMTPELFAEISRDLDARVSQIPTEIVRLDPEIVEVTTEGGEHWASVRFRGLVREDGAATAKPFDEMWNLVKPVNGSSGWLLAGIRQLDAEPAGHA